MFDGKKLRSSPPACRCSIATSTIAWLATEYALCSSAFVVVPPKSAPGSRASAAAIAESQSLAGLQSSSVNARISPVAARAPAFRAAAGPAFAWRNQCMRSQASAAPAHGTTGGSLPSSTTTTS